jgi:nucleoside-diphosphate-sugar epimerase
MRTMKQKQLSGQDRVLVCGAGGFIGGHRLKRLKAEGYWVRGEIAARRRAQSAVA